MAEFNYYPYEAGEGSSITESRWFKAFRWMRTNGILSQPTSLPTDGGLYVEPSEDAIGAQIQINEGEPWIEGGYFEQTDGVYEMGLQFNESGDPRIDLIVLRLDKATNITSYQIMLGEPSPSPVPPIPIQHDTIWDLPLAEVYVEPLAEEIFPENITDVRVRSMQGDGGSVAVTLNTAGGDETLVADSNAPPDLMLKGLTAGTNISLSSDADSVTISGANAPSDSPICFVYKDSATTGLTNGSTTTIEFDTSILNPNSMWDSITDPERITIGEDGVYLITALAGWTGVALSNGSIELQILLNGSAILTRSRMLLVGDETLYLNAEVFYSLTTTDYLTLAVINNSGQTLNLESNPQLQAIKIRG